MLEDLLQIVFVSITTTLFIVILYNFLISSLEISNNFLMLNSASTMSKVFLNQFEANGFLDKAEVFGSDKDFVNDFNFSVQVIDLESLESKNFGQEFNRELLMEQGKNMVSVESPCLLKSENIHACKVITRVWS